MKEVQSASTTLVELTDDELDLVAGGALVNVLVPVTVNNAANNNNIGIAAQALTANSGQTFSQRSP